MKVSKSILVSLAFILMITASATAQSDAKVIAVVNHAEWCPACKGNGERAQGAFMENNQDGTIQFVVNDLTTDETKQKSAKELKKVGLDKVMEQNKGTGVAYFFNAGTKGLITSISVTKTNEELAAAMLTAKKGVK